MRSRMHPTQVLPSALFRAVLVAPLLICALALLPAVPAGAAPESAAGGHDIGALMAAAEEHYDLSKLDAVLLIEDLTVTVAAGSRRTTVHRVAWLGTEIALDTYADLRIPHNTGTATLEVVALRTWMDGRWWPHESEVSPTAVVETTPGTIQSADDYTTMRETMLLHDGVELPCIVETIYTITERVPSGHGSDGLWVIPKADPAVLTVLSVEVPTGTTLHHAELNGTPAPEVATGDGVDSFVWRSEHTDRLERPLITDAAACAPSVVWSTWSDWQTLQQVLTGSMDDAMVLNETVTDTITRLVAARLLPLARVEAVMEFVNETTRSVRYDDSFWQLSPRTAERTWATAYGHGLDRAVLAAALFKEVGCEAQPVFIGPTLDGADDVPGLARFDGMMLVPDGTNALYDPMQGTLQHGSVQYVGSSIWVPSSGVAPRAVLVGSASRYELVLSLDSNDDGGWTGSGVLDTRSALSAYESVVGISGETGDHLGRVVRTALSGAELDGHSLAELTNHGVVAGFSLSLEAPEPDQNGRSRLELGDPAGGIMARLPSDVHLYSAHRDSPVRLPAAMEQTLTLVLELGDREVVRLPEERSLENTAGSFRLTVEQGSDRVTVTRSLTLTPGAVSDPIRGVTLVQPDEWPDLRALLLEESDHRNRVLLLE